MGDTRRRVLFLDDMRARHEAFRAASSTFDVIVDHVTTAAEAIQALRDRQYDQVFLDHDLSEEDIMSVIGASTKVPTGMAVVDFICLMDEPPREVFIHSCNTPAAEEMRRRIHRAHERVTALEIPFPQLINRMNQSR